MYSINEVCKMLDINASTIRYYESEKLIPELKRVNGIRVFDDKDVVLLKVVRCLKKTKMSISEIKEFMVLYSEGPSTIEKRKEIFAKHRENILTQIKELEDTLDLLDLKMKILNSDSQS